MPVPTTSKPPWLKVRAPGGDRYHELKATLRGEGLHTVCEEARCPNVGECWRQGTATVMLLGDVCTRSCRFCAVTSGRPGGAADDREPERVASAVARIGLRYVVLTMVDRDDLADGGAGHVARTVRAVRRLNRSVRVETLVGDFAGRETDVDVVVDAAPDVFAHNVEVVPRLQRQVRDARCGWERSLAVLARAKARAPERLVKSSLMVGIGETDAEVLDALRALRCAGVDIVTIGQYLRPTPRHHDVDRWVPPETFAAWDRDAAEIGFLHAATGPLVRSSYHAAEAFAGAEHPLVPAARLGRRPTESR